jgi:hypothetical protein
MFQNFKTLSTAALYLGSVCLVWIIYDTIKIYADLSSVIFLVTAGWFVGVGYVLIILFHILIIILYLKCFRHNQQVGTKIILISLFFISLFALAVEKVMYDKVGHEYLIEFPAPGEVNFIYLGLFLNAVFILYALYCTILEWN